MDRKTANREWRDATRGAPEILPTWRTVHAFAQRVEALAIAGAACCIAPFSVRCLSVHHQLQLFATRRCITLGAADCFSASDHDVIRL